MASRFKCVHKSPRLFDEPGRDADFAFLPAAFANRFSAWAVYLALLRELIWGGAQASEGFGGFFGPLKDFLVRGGAQAS